jgi:hypothetical protein
MRLGGEHAAQAKKVKRRFRHIGDLFNAAIWARPQQTTDS